MPNGYMDGTAADYAREAARGAQRSANETDQTLHNLIALLTAKGVLTQEECNVLLGRS